MEDPRPSREKRQSFWQRLNPLARRSRLPFVYSDRYSPEFSLGPLDTKRPLRILVYLESEKLLRRNDLHRPRRASLRQLRRVHPDPYLESLEEPEAMTTLLGFPLAENRQDAFLLALRAMVGGTLLATKLARERGGIGVNLGGGFHHALAEQGQGYCAFNDIAVAVTGRRSSGFQEPILVVDLDLHDGEGTRAIFADDPSVYTYSIHNRHLGPTEAVASSSIALGSEVEDATYLDTLRDSLPQIIEEFRPGLVYYLAGTDPALDDELGDWRISAEGLGERDRFVIEQIRTFKADCPVVILLAGGYGQGTWRYSAQFFSWLLGDQRVKEPPLTLELPLVEYRRIFQKLKDPDLTIEPADSDWALTEKDLNGAGPLHHYRFLDYYSKHGFEMALEKYGLFDRLRAKGYHRLKVEWHLDDPVGHTFRILSRDPPSPPLLELRLRRDRGTIPGMELLSVEWLLIQDSQASFTLERPLLPGQKYPGMGLLRDMSALLVLICERLNLDGLVFTPSHYYLALLGRRLIYFLDPQDDARFRALQQTTKNLRLLEAARVVDRGRVIDTRTGKRFRWQPSPAILPVSERLKKWLTARHNKDEVTAANNRNEYTIAENGTAEGGIADDRNAEDS